MNKKILLTIAMVMVFISAIVVATTKDKNQERISDINDYSRAYINNRQARVNKEKENRRGRKLYPGDVINIEGTIITLS